MSSYSVQRLVERKNVVKVGGGRGPCVKTFEQKRGVDLFNTNDDQASQCSSMMRSDRFDSSQRNRTAGDILGHTDEHLYSDEVNKMHVGRKVVDHPVTDGQKEKPFGTVLLTDVKNSDRYENTQRNKTSGDIIGHTDDQQEGSSTQSAFRAGRARVELEQAPEPSNALKVGRQRTDLPPAIASAEGVSPFATEKTPVEVLKQPIRHNNHYDHHDGLLTGGNMPRSTKKDNTPLWY